MNDKCKYCDYVSECSRKCEYDSILCKVQRSFPKVVDKSYEQLQQENKQLKDNWNKLKKYLINDINNRNGNRVIEYEDSRKVSETISPIYTLMEDKSKTMKEVLDKMQELEQGSDSNE